MKTNRIVPHFLFVVISFLLINGCAMMAKDAGVKQVSKEATEISPHHSSMASQFDVEKEQTSGGKADKAAFVEDHKTLAGKDRVDEITQKAEGSIESSDTEGQQILFDAGGNIDKKTPVPQKDVGDEIYINFEKTELSEVIREFADMLGINYILDSSASGTVTIHSSAPMDANQLYQVFLQILNVNGLTAIQVGELYHIGSSKNAPRMPILSRIGKSAELVGSGQRIIMQVIPLKYITCQQMSQVITPFISTDGTIFTYDDTNVMILVDKEINILKALRLVEVFDVDVFTEANYAIYRLEFVDAAETVGVIQELVSAYGSELQQGTNIISVDRLNTLIVFSKNQKVFDAIETFLKTLDVPTYNTEPQIYIYSVRNGRADELAEILGAVFSESADEKSTGSQMDTVPLTEEQQEAGNPFAIPGASETKGDGSYAGGAIGSGSMKGEVKITQDEIHNALIIQAIPSDYIVIEKVLNKLDVLPRQVLIEVTLVDVTLDKGKELGVDWEYTYNEGVSRGASFIQSTMSESGVSYLVGETNRWKSKLLAKASENKVNIISSPSILASDNKSATINISTEVPVATTQYETTSDTNALLQTNIQYRNTGVILTVTPHINEFGLVSMDINQEISEQSDPVPVGDVDLPSFFKRSVTTTLTVNNEQTIVIGGLIRENTTKGISGVPILKDIPFIGKLFGKSTDSRSKTELILLITPRVIVSLEDVNAVTEEFKSKVQGIVRYSSQ